jgi:tetraacyldisaccharide 4'-kinase
MLSLLAYLYGTVVSLRNYLYDRGVFESFDLGAPTISVGNITTGGTGKTPLVACIARILADRGERVCILTRGYGREDEKKRVLVSDGVEVLADFREAGDEPLELAQKLNGRAIVIADADRVAAAEWAKRKFGVTAFVLDDGFQHRRVRRDLDIVCIDATDPFGGRKLLPAGRLRERAVGLSRANAIVLTRVELAEDVSGLRSEISDLASNAVIFEARTSVVTTLNTRDPAFAFCGIGNPTNFFGTLERAGIPVKSRQIFADHHPYSQDDIDRLHRAARESACEIFVTTAKDAVRISELKFDIPYSVVEVEVEIDDAAMFASML